MSKCYFSESSIVNRDYRKGFAIHKDKIIWKIAEVWENERVRFLRGICRDYEFRIMEYKHKDGFYLYSVYDEIKMTTILSEPLNLKVTEIMKLIENNYIKKGE